MNWRRPIPVDSSRHSSALRTTKRSAMCAVPASHQNGGPCLLRRAFRTDDEVVMTRLEHHANIVPWQLLSQLTTALLKAAPAVDAGNPLMSEFDDPLGTRTKLIAAAGFRCAGRRAGTLGVLFVSPGHDPLEVGEALNADGIAVRAGHQRAQPILRRPDLQSQRSPFCVLQHVRRDRCFPQRGPPDCRGRHRCRLNLARFLLLDFKPPACVGLSLDFRSVFYAQSGGVAGSLAECR